MAKQRLYLIDATAFCYRAFYALPALATSFGQQTGAVYGFINILNKILKSQKPDYLAVCFDVSRETFRQKKFTDYKIHRPPMPDMLSSQIPLIKQVISAYRIVLLEKEGFEADDIIATLAKKALSNGLATTIVSSDKDILQLVDDDISVLSPHKEENLIYDRVMVKKRFGVEPKKINDIIALMGDSADNIPGVAGIGEKTATKLIANFGSVEQLLNNIEQIQQPKIKEAIQNSIEQIKLSKELATLDENVDIEFDLEGLKIGQPDSKELFAIFKRLEFKKLLKDLPNEEAKSEASKIEEIKDAQLKGLVNKEDELYLCGCLNSNLAFFTDNKFFKVGHTGPNLKEIMQDKSIKKIGHDLKKAKVALVKETIALEGLFFDTMIAAYLLNPSKTQYSLADVAWDYLGESVNSDTLNEETCLKLVLRLKPKLETELREKSLYELFNNLEMPLVEVLAEMESNGIKLDLKVIKELSQDIKKRLIKLIEDIYEISGSQFNINSPKQLRDILFDRLKLPVVKKTKTGPSTDEEVLRALADKHKLPAMLLEYRQLTKLKNTYIDVLPGLIDKDSGRIHASFNQTGTETGRLSSSNPNLQNIPVKTDIGKNIRRAIIASDKDSCLLSCDYSQIELRILAHISQDKSLTEAFKQDKDVHRLSASLIFGIDENSVTQDMRDTAKRVNFGIIYGLTSYGLSRDLKIRVDEAQNFIDAYFLRYPGVKDYIDGQIKKAQENGFVTTLLGRRRYIPDINNKSQGIRQFAQRQAVNTPIQGSASDLIKLAMVAIHKETKQKYCETKMIMQIHDELVFDIRLDELKEVAALAKDRMEHALKLDVPIKVDMKMGRNWLEMEEVR